MKLMERRELVSETIKVKHNMEMTDQLYARRMSEFLLIAFVFT